MAVAKGKGRITITLGDKVLEKLDEYCEMTGLTKSAAVGSIVASALVLERPIIDWYRSGQMLDPDITSAMGVAEQEREGLL